MQESSFDHPIHLDQFIKRHDTLLGYSANGALKCSYATIAVSIYQTENIFIICKLLGCIYKSMPNAA